MRTIDMLGGMSWESSAVYYRIANELIAERVGGFHSAKVILDSVDFADIERLQSVGAWQDAGELLAQRAVAVEAAGAELLVLCTNTMHLVIDAITTAVSIPVIHIADAAATAVRADRLTTVGLLGTSFTMEHPFYADRLRQHGVDVLVPTPQDRAVVHDVIYGELVHGIVREASRVAYEAVIQRLVARGAEGIVLGCTEIELLLTGDAGDLPLYPTTRLHVRAAVDAALAT